jgi:sugar phosphate isomerase/epimerase
VRRKIVKCIKNPKQFSKELFEKLEIGVEIQDFVNPNLLDGEWEKRVEEYKFVLEDFDEIISFHGPFLDLNPSSPDKQIVEITKRRYLQALNIANELNASYIIFHSQVNPWLKDPRIVAESNKNQSLFWKDILECLKDHDMDILIENIFEDAPRELSILMDEINQDKMNICFDVGHSRLAKNTELQDWIATLNHRIKYVHLHWNERIYDEHNSPTDANLFYFNKILNKNEVEPMIALEYHVNNLEEEIKRVRRCFN